ncbi:MAG: NADH-quinone oxidoreductase subunit I [Candidatus Aminicenantes bacterium]|nr:NADH-quinone oxidoreductase subunit I [Candidatus Aminicenantes bacterium]TFG58745.1 MAG: NADH-quinone oxidoreductase subunit I [Candidatus Aminicenantes bacterium]
MKIGRVLKELLRGGWITARHFFVNMFFHTLKLFGVKTKRRGAVTIQYPEERKELSPRHRSLHRVLSREDGKPRCVACMLCVTVCPSECLSVEAAEDDDPEVQKYPARFVVDLSRCCFCGFCVEACPVDAIRMDTGEIRLASDARSGLDLPLEKR